MYITVPIFLTIHIADCQNLFTFSVFFSPPSLSNVGLTCGELASANK